MLVEAFINDFQPHIAQLEFDDPRDRMSNAALGIIGRYLQDAHNASLPRGCLQIRQPKIACQMIEDRPRQMPQQYPARLTFLLCNAIRNFIVEFSFPGNTAMIEVIAPSMAITLPLPNALGRGSGGEVEPP